MTHLPTPALLLALLLGLAGATAPLARTAIPESATDVQLSFAPLVKKVAPAVVNVYVRARVREFVSPFEDPFFRRFFDDFGVPQERRANSLGSGVIVSEDGVVVTNAHVIKGGGGRAAEVKVALTDKREFDARVLLLDEKSDVAVLRIDAADKSFPFLDLVDSDLMEVGDLVLAIGNPFGVGQTVTSGIVSGLARTAVGRSEQQVFIQTDAAINPGNSGGALIDMSGGLVGINTAIYSRSGGSHGIGFAIPSNLVRPFVESAITGQAIRRPWLGAKLEAVTREIADALGLERVSGALITTVYPEGPAAAAGLKPRDIVTAVDEWPTDDPRSLTYRLNTKGVGSVIKLKILRDGQETVVRMRLKEAPGLDTADQRELSGRHPLDGTRVAELSPAIAEELNLQDLAGVVVTDVKPNTVAAGLGLQPGDVVLRVGRVRIETIGQLQAALDEPHRSWRLDIKRGGQVFQLVLPG